MSKTLVLLSGGLDSTAALIWAHRQSSNVHALFIYYGQPPGQREHDAAISASKALGIPFNRIDVSSAFYGVMPRGLFVAQESGTTLGVDNAFVPVRNPVLLSTAAARALMLWPGESVRLVVGFNQGDVSGFPDCSGAFVAAFERAVNLGLGTHERVAVEAPWAAAPKSEIVKWVQDNAPEHLHMIHGSWSCYRERGPCGECTACITREAALR